MSIFNVVILGHVQPGKDPTEVRDALAQLLKQTVDVADRLLAGKPTRIKSGVDEATGRRYVDALHSIGVASRFEPDVLDIDPDIFDSPKKASSENTAPERQKTSRSDLSQYYQDAFQKIDSSPGKMISSWNWGAFWFGPFWYVYRGMWAKAIIYALVAFGTGGLALLLLFLYGGACGTYDYYLLKVRGTQLWGN
jgi:hypothetical protein